MSIFTAAAVAALAASCSPSLPPQKITAYALVESGFDSNAVQVNGPGGGKVQVRDRMHAIEMATRLVRAGKSVDLGLMQVNSQWLRRFGLSVSEALEPCTNVRLAGVILSDAERQVACIYNTGKPACHNGYPEKIAQALDTKHPFQSAPTAESAPFSDVFAQSAVSPVEGDLWGDLDQKSAGDDREAAPAVTLQATQED